MKVAGTARPRRTAQRVAALAVAALAASLALAPVAQADGSAATADRPIGTAGTSLGSFSVGDVELPESGCVAHAYVVDLDLAPETTDYHLEVVIRAADLETFHEGWLGDYNITGGPRTLTEPLAFCAGDDPTGTYRVTGVLHTYEGLEDRTATPHDMVPAEFAVLPHGSATPAPTTQPTTQPTTEPTTQPTTQPTTEPVHSQVSGTVAKTAIARGVRFVFRSRAVPAGTVARPLVWKVRYDGRSTRISQGPSERDVLRMRFPRGRHVVRVFRNGTRVLTATVRVR